MILTNNKTITLISHTIFEEKIKRGFFMRSMKLASSERFIFHQISAMPTYFKVPFYFILIYFKLSSMIQFARNFNNLSYERRLKLVCNWRESPFNFKRDFIKFFDSLIIFDLACKENL